MELISEILGYLKGFGDLNTAGKIGAVVMILMALWKSSLLRPWWDKLGSAKVIIAPLLGLALALVKLPWDSGSVLEVLKLGLQGGALAMGLHLLLNAVKELPFVGEKYDKWLDLIDKLLLRPKIGK
jgi:hypothetical protein